MNAEPKKLFKYYLDQQIATRDARPLFFRRNLRWRVNSREFAQPLSKKGLLRGYIKYGIFAYMGWYYVTQKMFASGHHEHHGEHGHHAEHGHGDHHGAAAHGHGNGHGDSHGKAHH